nr:zinc knuckle CX2CX4HX4C [Tanacetum cinerariifolium]
MQYSCGSLDCEGISALASRIGKPLVMDVVTASKCRQRIGMLRFARVLIELNRAPKINETALSMNLIDNDRKLECIHTEIDEIGVEVVVFDDIMMAEGIKRWDLTLCGFFCRA